MPSCNGAAAMANKDAVKHPSPQPPPNPSSGGCTESPPPNPTSGDCVLVSSPSTDNDDAQSLPPNPPSIVTSGDYVPVSHPSVDYHDIKSAHPSPPSNPTSGDCVPVSPLSIDNDDAKSSTNPLYNPTSGPCVIVSPPNSPSGQTLWKSLRTSHRKDPCRYPPPNPSTTNKNTNKRLDLVLHTSTKNSRTDDSLSNKPKYCSHKLKKLGQANNISCSRAIACQESGCTYNCRTIVQLRKHLTTVHGMKMVVEKLTFRTTEGM